MSESRKCVSNNTLKTTAGVIYSLGMGAALVSNTILLNKNVIQVSRGLNQSETKNDIKDGAALTSSVTTNSIAALELLLFIATVALHKDLDKLRWYDRFTIGLALLSGLAGMVYSLARFDVEHNQQASGLCASAAVASFGVALSIYSHALGRSSTTVDDYRENDLIKTNNINRYF